MTQMDRLLTFKTHSGPHKCMKCLQGIFLFIYEQGYSLPRNNYVNIFFAYFDNENLVVFVVILCLHHLIRLTLTSKFHVYFEKISTALQASYPQSQVW